MKLVWTKQEIIESLRAYHGQKIDLCSRSMQLNQDPKKKRLFYGAIHRFGSWPEALSAAGIPYNEITKKQRRARSQIIGFIKEAERSGRNLNPKNISKDKTGRCFYFAATKIKEWGEDNPYIGWPGAMLAAGLDPKNFGVRITRSSYKD